MDNTSYDIIAVCRRAHEEIKRMKIEHKCGNCGLAFNDLYALEYHKYRDEH